MFSEEILRRVIKKLMLQVEEEKRRREEAIRALTNISMLPPQPIRVPTDEEIERRIEELSQV